MKKKIFVELIIISSFLLILLLFNFILNILIYNLLVSNKHKLFNEIKKNTDFEVKYKKISSNIIGNLNVYEVILYNPNGIVIELGDIEISYSIFSLFSRDFSFFSFAKKIKIKNLDIKVDLSLENNFLDKMQKYFFEKKNRKVTNKIHIKKLLIDIPNANFQIIKNNTALNIKTKKCSINFNNDVFIDSILLFDFKNNDKSYFKSNIEINGNLKLYENFFCSNFKFDLRDSYFQDDKILDQKFTFESTGKNFIFRRINDFLPVNLLIQKNSDIIKTYINIDNLNLQKIFITNKNILIPDILTVKTLIDYDLIKKNSNGKFIFSTNYEKVLFLKKFGIDIKLDISNNTVLIKNFLIYNINKLNNINIQGGINLNNLEYNLSFHFNDFILPYTRINSKFYLKKKENITSISGDYFLLNDIYFSNFNYIATQNDNITEIRTLKSFNGFNITGKIINEKNSTDYELKNNFNFFSITKFINAYNKKFNDELMLNGPLNFVSNNNNFIINDSKINVLKNYEYLSRIDIKQNDKLLTIKSNIENKEKFLNLIFDYKKKPIIGIASLKWDKIGIDIISKFKEEKILFAVNNNLNITYNLSDNKIFFIANNFNLPLKNNDIKLDFNFSIDIKKGIIGENKIIIKNLNLFNEYGYISTIMSLKNNEFNLKDFIYKDKSNTITGEILHKINFDKEINISGKGFLSDYQKNETYDFNYEILNSILNGKLYILNMDIKKLLPNNKISGGINLRVKASGEIKNPLIEMEADLSNGKYDKSNLDLFIIANKESKNINIKRGNIQLDQNRISLKESQIILEKDNKKINLFGSFYIEGMQKVLKANFNISGNYSSDNYDNILYLNLGIENTTLGFLNNKNLQRVEKLKPIQFNIYKNNKSLKIKDSKEQLFSFIHENNNISINCFNNNELVLDSHINTSNNELNGTIKLNKFPVNIIQKILQPYVGIDEGLLNGNIELKGKTNKPEFYGKINLYSGVVSLPDYLQAPIINITSVITINKDKFLVRNVNGEVRKGLAHGYGEVIFNGWKFERYYFELNSDNVPCLIKKGPVDAKGIGYIEKFIFEGNPKVFNFIADLVIESADINLESLMGTNKSYDIGKMPLNVYINFKTGSRIKVNYPIVSGILNPGEKFVLKFNGEEPHLYLGGSASFKKGEVNYLNKKFKVEHAIFQFHEDEENINPSINLKAFYRTKDSKKDSILVYLTMSNRLFPLETSFYTFPYRNQEEINELLGLTYALKEQDENNDLNPYNNNYNNNNIDTLVDTTNYLSNAFIFNSIENKVRKITGLDTFILNTKIFGNILKSNSESYKNTLDLMDESSLTMGKYIFDELYFESMMSFNKKKKLNETFFLPLNDQNYGFNLQFMLQLELPYFMIGYNFLPKDYNNLLNAEHKVSVEFNYKF